MSPTPNSKKPVSQPKDSALTTEDQVIKSKSEHSISSTETSSTEQQLSDQTQPQEQPEVTAVKPNVHKPPMRSKANKNRLVWSDSNNLFEMIGLVSYTAIIGSFVAAFILFLVLVILKPLVIFSNFTFYTGLGILVYTSSFLLWKFATKPKLVGSNIDQAKLLIQQNYNKRLLIYLIGTSVFYLLLCWIMMIMLGSFNGFGIKFIDNSQLGAFGEQTDLYQMRINGFILFYVFFFVFLISFLIFWFFTNWKQQANQILTKRRKMIAEVNAKAQESV